jgi:arsenite methyltransferase
MRAKDLKLIVKEKYGKIAEQSNTEQSSCCGPSCCGPQVDYTVFSENYESKDGYNPDADIKEGDHVLDLGRGIQEFSALQLQQKNHYNLKI